MFVTVPKSVTVHSHIRPWIDTLIILENVAFNKIKSVIICVFFYFSVFSPGIFFSQTEHTPDTKTVNYSVTKLPEHLKSGGIPPFFRVRP